MFQCESYIQILARHTGLYCYLCVYFFTLFFFCLIHIPVFLVTPERYQIDLASSIKHMRVCGFNVVRNSGEALS